LYGLYRASVPVQGRTLPLPSMCYKKLLFLNSALKKLITQNDYK